MSIPELKQRIAAKMVVEADSRLLILHPSAIDLNRNWHISGGIRDDINEPILETGIRELFEETKIDVRGLPHRVIKVGEWLAEDKGEKVKILAVFFHYVLEKMPSIMLSEEHDDAAWITRGNYHDYPANKEVYELVEELLPAR